MFSYPFNLFIFVLFHSLCHIFGTTQLINAAQSRPIRGTHFRRISQSGSMTLVQLTSRSVTLNPERQFYAHRRRKET